MPGMKLLWRRFACDCQSNAGTTELLHESYRSRHRLGNGCSARCARLAGERWFQRELPSVQRRDGGGSVATNAAGVRVDERPGVGIHRYVRPGQQYPIPAWTTAGLTSPRYTDDFNAVKALGRATGSTRTEDQTALALFWEGNASVHWNQAANQIARANHLSLSASNRLLAVLNIAMADTAFTIWSAKRFYGSIADRCDLAAGNFNPDGGQRRQSGYCC